MQAQLPNGEDITREWGVGFRNDPAYPLRRCRHCGRELGEDRSGKWRHLDYGTLACPTGTCYMDACDNEPTHPEVDYCDYHAPHPHDDQL